MPWIACLAAPLFPLAARLRSEPDLRGEAVVVVRGNGNAARVVAATRRGRRAGIEAGQTLTQARALLPKLVVRPRDPECEHSAREALLEAAGELSPRLEDGGEGVVYADAEGLERHLQGLVRNGTSRGETWQEILGRALMETAERAGVPVRVGVARSKLAARMAAERPGGPTVVEAGREAAFLAPLPLPLLLRHLEPEDDPAPTLERWGVRTAGDLARLPAAEVASRLGDAGEALHALARGDDPTPLVPWSPPPVFREGMTLDWPLTNLEPFLFVGRAALERLVARLEARGLACARIEVALRLEPDGAYRRGIDLPAPSCEVKTLLTLVRLDLEAHPPGAPVAGFTLTAHPDRPRQAQLSLFGPEALSPDRLATTLARLFALLGPGRVGAPERADGHRPERFALGPYAPPPPPDGVAAEGDGGPAPRPPDGGRGLLAVRVLRPPVPLEVICGEDGRREPLSVTAEVRDETARRPKIHGRVRVASGPWGLEEEWWSEEPVERAYWDVELASGGIYRIYRDAGSNAWFADGVYD